MQSPKVSVVMPVYNTEAFVEAAVRSIMEQTLHEIEILIADDGSTDGSPAILTRLAAEDDRIRILHQSNAGQSAARNTAFAAATGEYVFFMDSDDLLEADALELSYAKCSHEKLDFILFDADTFGTETPPEWFDYHRAAILEERIYTGPEILERLLDNGKYRVQLCTHFIRRALLTEHQICFYPGIIHEDELYATLFYLCATRAGRIDRAFFKRRLREGSTMGTAFSERNLKGYLTVFDELKRITNGCSDETRRLVCKYLRYTIDPVLRNAWQLPLRVRLRTAFHVTTRFFGCVRPSALAILLLKSPLKHAGQ